LASSVSSPKAILGAPRGVVGLDLSVSAVLTALAKQRPIFHSEADFQHAIAWEIHKHLPRASVRLERPIASLLRGYPEGNFTSDASAS
jgi:hypothetical protein